VSQEVLDVGLEPSDNSFSGVELLDTGIDVGVAFGGVEVQTEPAEEDEFASLCEYQY
jgi:hypothetical protein